MKIKNPIINSILYVILFFIINSIIGAIIQPVCQLCGITNTTVIFCIVGILMFVSYYLIFRKKFNDLISTKNFKTGFILALPVLLYLVATFLLDPSADVSKFNLTLNGIIFAIIGGLGPGITEEVMFRGALVNGFMIKNNKESFIPIAVLLSALLFALIHAANLLVGADVNQTILQLIYSFALGALFAAVYLRTGNLLVLIFFHSFIDFVGFLTPEISQTGGVLTTATSIFAPYNLAYIVISVILLILAFYYVRSEKRGEIMELWDSKKI